MSLPVEGVMENVVGAVSPPESRAGRDFPRCLSAPPTLLPLYHALPCL